MTSIGKMIQQIAALADTKDVNDWENGFIKNIVEISDNGKYTFKLSSRQVEKIETIWKKHFA